MKYSVAALSWLRLIRTNEGKWFRLVKLFFKLNIACELPLHYCRSLTLKDNIKVGWKKLKRLEWIKGRMPWKSI